MSAPHRVLRFCLLLAGLLPCVLSVRAETGKLNVHVTNCLNAPVMNVTVGV